MTEPTRDNAGRFAVHPITELVRRQQAKHGELAARILYPREAATTARSAQAVDDEIRTRTQRLRNSSPGDPAQ